MDNIFLFLTNNIVTLLALIASLVALVTALVGKNKQKAYASIPALITAAQALELANDDKFKYVLDMVYNSIPKFFKYFIDEQDIANAIQYTFDKLKVFAQEQAIAEAIKANSLKVLTITTPNPIDPATLATAIKASNTSVEGLTHQPFLSNTDVNVQAEKPLEAILKPSEGTVVSTDAPSDIPTDL